MTLMKISKGIVIAVIALVGCTCEKQEDVKHTTCYPSNRSIVTCKDYIVKTCTDWNLGR
jgi:hypothetical protein